MSNESTLFLSASTCADLSDYKSVTFAAVSVDKQLCERLTLLAAFCRQHQLEWVKAPHTGKSVFWDTPRGSRLEDFMPEWTEWQVSADYAHLTLWGRLPCDDGGYTGVEPLATTWLVDVKHLAWLFEQGFDVDYCEIDDWEEVTGTQFALTVHERLSELRAERLARERDHP